MARHELWVELADRPGNLAALAGDLAACDANVVHLDVLAGTGDTVIDRLVVQVPDQRSGELAAVARRCGATLRPLDDTGSPGPPPPHSPVMAQAADSRSGRVADPGPPVRRSPTTLERLVALPDGDLVRLRHLGAGDRNALIAHHGRCSEATRRHSRFLSPAADSDANDLVALAAVVGGTIVGVAQYELRDRGTRADLAVIVEDGHQRRGIGAVLVNELATLASNAGATHLRAVGPAGSDGLAGMLRHAGLEISVRREGEGLVFDCALPHGLLESA